MPAGYDTYRAYRCPWVGEPLTQPTAEATRTGRQVTVNAIWNGATEVGRWVVLAGARPGSLRPVGSATGTASTPRSKSTPSPYVEVVAVDDHGRRSAARRQFR